MSTSPGARITLLLVAQACLLLIDTTSSSAVAEAKLLNDANIPDLRFQFSQISSGISYRQSGETATKKVSTLTNALSDEYSQTNSRKEEQASITKSEIIGTVSGKLGASYNNPAKFSISIAGNLGRSEKHISEDESTIRTATSTASIYSLKKAATNVVEKVESNQVTFQPNDGYVQALLTIENNSDSDISLTRVEFHVFGVDPLFPEKKSSVARVALTPPTTGTTDSLGVDPTKTTPEPLRIELAPHGSFQTPVFVTGLPVNAIYSVLSSGKAMALQVNLFDGLMNGEPLDIEKRRARVLATASEIHVDLGTGRERIFYIDLSQEPVTLADAISATGLSPIFQDGALVELAGRRNELESFSEPPRLYSQPMNKGRWVIAILDEKTPLKLSDPVPRGTRFLVIFIKNLDMVRTHPPQYQSDWFSFAQQCSATIVRPNPIRLFDTVARGSVIKLELKMKRLVASTSTKPAAQGAPAEWNPACSLARATSYFVTFTETAETTFHGPEDAGLTFSVDGVAARISDLKKSLIGFHADAVGNLTEVFLLGSDFTVSDQFALDLTSEPKLSGELEYGRRGGGANTCRANSQLTYTTDPADPKSNWYHNNPFRKISLQEPVNYTVRVTLFPPVQTDEEGKALLRYDAKMSPEKVLKSQPPPTPKGRFDPCVWQGESFSDVDFGRVQQ
ncbi:hypothetical protein [Bradyrhizobium sp. 18]|uniref:hypothetical protein n=1 Tax=Bradyrhizobium sp. 18 TaxID=2782657 RepID=UPI001FF8EB3F|nr:hypothetical protein [Bradyrhizobium sp. 18]MCK1506305.1 hypothetical protein [Bradyrhizobium sp. 18]